MATYRETGGFAGHIEVASAELLARIANEVAEDAKRFAPVDTGHLRGSIESELVGPRLARVSARASYARWVEMGTSKMRARPFLRPALFKRRSG